MDGFRRWTDTGMLGRHWIYTMSARVLSSLQFLVSVHQPMTEPSLSDRGGGTVSLDYCPAVAMEARGEVC